MDLMEAGHKNHRSIGVLLEGLYNPAELYNLIDVKLDKIKLMAGVLEDGADSSIALSREGIGFSLLEKYQGQLKRERFDLISNSVLRNHDFLRCYATMTAVEVLLDSNCKPVMKYDIKVRVQKEAARIVGFYNDKVVNLRLRSMVERFKTFADVEGRYGSTYPLKGHVLTYHSD